MIAGSKNKSKRPEISDRLLNTIIFKKDKMMKVNFIITMLTALLLSPLSNAESSAGNNERAHYKCHLILSDQSEVVHGFVSVGETKTKFLQGLPKRTVYTENEESLPIETIYQCVTKDQRFATKQARKIEENTPF